MKKGKSIYTFQLNCDPALANNLIKSYIQSNKYTLQNKNNEKYYRCGDAMVGYKYFNYLISGQTLTIYAWLKNTFGKDLKIEQNSLNMMSMSYRKSLNPLFEEISKLNDIIENNNVDNLSQQSYVNYDVENNNSVKTITEEPALNNTSDFYKTFKNETIKKQERMCEVGFWLSLLGFLASFTGVLYGILIYVMNFYFASQGLKTRKKGKAIATIVLSILSIFIALFIAFVSLMLD